jgi:type IV fimbrial biogenesis protein FimT
MDHRLSDQLVDQGRPVLSTRAKSASGFTMIEMIVTLSIFSILVALTVPTMQKWIASTKVRAVADSLQNGVRMAQTESLRRSRQVVFALTTNAPTTQSPAFTASNNGNNWAIQTNPALTGSGEAAAFIGAGVLTSAGSAVAIQGPAEICFNSVGRLVVNPNTSVPGGTCQPGNAIAGVYNYQVSLSNYTLNVNVAVGGQIRICDPTQVLSDSNPYGC